LESSVFLFLYNLVIIELNPQLATCDRLLEEEKLSQELSSREQPLVGQVLPKWLVNFHFKFLLIDFDLSLDLFDDRQSVLISTSEHLHDQSLLIAQIKQHPVVI
jgi:hypothetical protein